MDHSDQNFELNRMETISMARNSRRKREIPIVTHACTREADPPDRAENGRETVRGRETKKLHPPFS